MEKEGKKKHYILVDAEYAEAVAGRLRSHYAEVLGREVPRLDMADWLTCCALDSGLQQGNNEVYVSSTNQKRSIWNTSCPTA